MTKHHTRAVIDGHTVEVVWIGRTPEGATGGKIDNEELMTRIESKLAELKAEVEG